jgi:hypothetical protein
VTRRLASALLVAAVLLTAACRRDGRPDWRVVQLYGGPGSVEALTSPVTVEAFRIDSVPRKPEPGVAFVGVHAVTAGPVSVSAEAAKELSAVLADADTYDWHRAKSDPYRPTVGLRFSRDVSRVDLALDFVSNMLTVHRHGKMINVEDIDDGRARLLAVVKPLFPDDPDVQALE